MPAPDLELPEHAAIVLDQMERHATVRRFTAAPLPSGLLERLVQAASKAATSSWIQGYVALRVTAPEERRALAELAGGQAQVREAPEFLVLCADSRRHRLAARSAGTEHATNLEAFLQCALDAALFAQNLALGAEACGLGTCMIGGLRNELPRVVDLLELPEGVWPLFGLCLGEPAEAPLRRPRLSTAALLVEGRYPSDDEVRAHVKKHDEDAERWYAATGRPGRTWSGGVVRTFGSLRREHLRATYEGLGARLV